MKIISFWAKSHDFEIDEIQFPSNPTLLVGESGAGKTQILKALLMLREIATKEKSTIPSYSIEKTGVRVGFEWELNFEIKKINYTWKGIVQEDVEITDNDAFDFIHIDEFLYQKDKPIFERIDYKKNKFDGNDLPSGFNSDTSFIYQFKNNDLVKPVYQAFSKMQHYDMTKERERIYFKRERVEFDNYKTETDLINSNLSILEKIFVASGNRHSIVVYLEKDSVEKGKYQLKSPKFDVFTKIQNDFKDIFPNISAIFVGIESERYLAFSDKYSYLSIVLKLQNGKTISQENISSGMLRTLYHLAEIYLSPPETVILIDEFENSLGTNCMDVLVDGIIHQNKNVQYIITSHHPYIINNVPYQHWKVVSRDENGVVKTKDGVDIFGKGVSKQDAYWKLMQLQNHEE
jgi:predicted ATP-dependent endonuclease of OLD family